MSADGSATARACDGRPQPVEELARRARGRRRRGRRPRLRRPVLAADRAPRARVRRVQRAAAAPRRRSRRSPRRKPHGSDPVGRPGLGVRGGRAAAGPRAARARHPRARHLLRHAAARARARRAVEGARSASSAARSCTVHEPGRLLARHARASRPAGCRTATRCSSRRPGFTALASLDARRRSRRSRTSRAASTASSSTPRSCTRPYGQQVLTRFLDGHLRLRRARGSPASIVEEQIARIRAQVGDGHVICGLSGGVDSSVAALLVHRAIGDQLTCVFVDHGLMRKNEGEQVVSAFRDPSRCRSSRSTPRSASSTRLAGVSDPEAKRKAIGAEFIRVFEEEAAQARRTARRFLVQGTLYSDVIESGGGTGAATIKSHHNVGGLPDDLEFELVEPLRALFKDEVRAVGAELGLPERLVWRQPFPGPGPRDPHRRRRGDQGAPRRAARRRRDPAGRDPQGRPVPRAVAVLLRAARRPHGRRAGRRAHVRLRRRRSARSPATTR